MANVYLLYACLGPKLITGLAKDPSSCLWDGLKKNLTAKNYPMTGKNRGRPPWLQERR